MEAHKPDRRLAAIVRRTLSASAVLWSWTRRERSRASRRAARVDRPGDREVQGRIIKTTGDGLLVEFQSVTEAVRCATDFQGAWRWRNGRCRVTLLLFRIGINLGDVIVEEDDIFGDGVNVAARLESIAEPGGVYVSAAVRDQVGDRLDVVFEDLGDHSVKNISRPIRVFRSSSAARRRTPPGPRGASPRRRKVRRNRRSRFCPSST